MKRTLLFVAALLLASACTPQEALFWDALLGREPGTTERLLCEMDPTGEQGLCPITHITEDEYTLEFPDGIPADWEERG